MNTIVDLSGLDRLIERVETISKLDATPLMLTWMNIIEEDNRKGVMAGTDKDGNYMFGVTYRPKTAKPLKIGSKAADRLRNHAHGRARVGAFSGFGPAAAGLNNNLTSSEYRMLGGPPLAPRGVFSRVITNLRTDYGQDGDRNWFARGFWFEVVSKKGVPFLNAHFEGKNGLPKRDLRGVRPEGLAKARRAMVAWMSDLIRYAATGQMNRPAA